MGQCLLTGNTGKMVKSHIIPKSLTRNEVKGDYFIEERDINGKKIYAKCYDSWNDVTIVTQKGEDILQDLDDFAIKELRRTGLVWSGDFKDFSISKSENQEKFKIEIVSFINPEKMRLYFLSLLWRASVSSLHAFSNIKLDELKIEKLKNLITGQTKDDFSLYPIHLFSLSLGEKHNYSAEFDEVDGIKYFRFYHDGLIIRFMDKEIDYEKIKIPYSDDSISDFVADSKYINIGKIQFEGSKQEFELLEVRRRYESK